MDERFLIIDTAHRQGIVALAEENRVLGQRPLEESRRHARDLVPFARELLQEQGWQARDLTGVIVSRGPGSYTGLRVGLMSAKTLAYATGCSLLGVNTFDACAQQFFCLESAEKHPSANAKPPSEAGVACREKRFLDVIADAQQGKIYVQRFLRGSKSALEIKPWTVWLETLPPGSWVTGPGLEILSGKLPQELRQAPREEWLPRPETLLALALERFRRGDKDDPFTLEPLYLRPSAAEEKLKE